MKNQKMAMNRKILLELLSIAFPQTIQKKNYLSLNILLPMKLKSFMILLLFQLIVIYISNGVMILVLGTQKVIIESFLADDTRLMAVISNLKRELNKVKGEKKLMYKSIRMLNSGTRCLEQILSESNPSRDVCGIGFTGSKAEYGSQSRDKGKQKNCFCKGTSTSSKLSDF